MNRDQLAHVLRAACQIADDPRILVIGSQAILGTCDEDLLPAPATASREVDIAFIDDSAGTKADRVDAAIGELSPFDEQFEYYAQGVEVRTASTAGRLAGEAALVVQPLHGDADAFFLDVHDLALAKLSAYREKDRAFVAALLDAGLLDIDVLVSRAQDLPVQPIALTRIRDSSDPGPRTLATGEPSGEWRIRRDRTADHEHVDGVRRRAGLPRVADSRGSEHHQALCAGDGECRGNPGWTEKWPCHGRTSPPTKVRLPRTPRR